MKAILVREFGGPEVLKFEEAPTPKPGAGQVLVRIHAAGVNPYDTYMRSGTYAVKPPLPYTPGSDGAGVIDAVGEGVRACGFRMEPLIMRCIIPPRRERPKPSWCTAPAAESAWLLCSSPAPWASQFSELPEHRRALN